MKQNTTTHKRTPGLLRRLADWVGHLTLIDSRWGHRVIRQVYREREFEG